MINQLTPFPVSAWHKRVVTAQGKCEASVMVVCSSLEYQPKSCRSTVALVYNATATLVAFESSVVHC